ncbi:translation machinery-associated protein 16-like [Ostrea edulis]|uniref:translation machinery-associated protein 16-like n=1 Tax=Ostrea edulis TaxID=37623 RepID=UPI002094A2D9|nr:translation machinery-associated protein 16-like [Ostrea edulis]XP_048752116.1 translation machinery-associated protein 16-like [Ostrea edulis]XP_048752117.1 translation machinery-associated protein 16-like [Ostrea edulis]XP_056009088.1 translation machinery-associated protein 16-like [Ostrea edulis]XP_056009089.1 translation machinery-associated protein 16-like [Ostrea edulis]
MPKTPRIKVGKEKSEKVVHPNSRKAAYLAGKVNRDERVKISKQASSLKLEVLAEKLLWFKERLDPQKKVFTRSDLGHLVKDYLQRFESELEQIDIVRSVGKRQGNPHSSRENAVKLTIEREKRQIDEGSFEVPHIFNAKNLAFLRAWNGEIKYVKNIKLSKITAKDLEGGEVEESTKEEEKEDNDKAMEDDSQATDETT